MRRCFFFFKNYGLELGWGLEPSYTRIAAKRVSVSNTVTHQNMGPSYLDKKQHILAQVWSEQLGLTISLTQA